VWDRVWDLDWANAQTLYILLVVPVIAAVYRWLTAKSALEDHYRDQRAMTTASLATDEIYPRLAKLVVCIPPPMGLMKPRPWRPGDESDIEDHLQAVAISRMVTEVTPFFAASADCKRCQLQIENWLKGQAWGLLGYLPGALFIIWAVLQQSYSMPATTYWIAVCDCLVGATAAVVFFGLERAARNRLAKLSMDPGASE
jgi:hypothetical protein